MKYAFRGIVLLYLLSLSPVLCRAERLSVTHDFSTMSSGESPALVCTLSNTVGTTDFVTYTCSGTDAKFGGAFDYSGLAINLPAKNAKVTTTEISELVEIILSCYAAPKTDIKVSVSEDNGSSWTLLTEGVTIDGGGSSIRVVLPRGDYCVRILNNTATNFSIKQIIWYRDHCNCFKYVP